MIAIIMILDLIFLCLPSGLYDDDDNFPPPPLINFSPPP